MIFKPMMIILMKLRHSRQFGRNRTAKIPTPTRVLAKRSQRKTGLTCMISRLSKRREIGSGKSSKARISRQDRRRILRMRLAKIRARRALISGGMKRNLLGRNELTSKSTFRFKRKSRKALLKEDSLRVTYVLIPTIEIEHSYLLKELSSMS